MTRLRGLTFVPLELEDYLDARRAMDMHAIDFEDAIHLAVAMRMGASGIVTNDRDFDRTPVIRTF